MSYTGIMELSEINMFVFDDSAVDVFVCDSLNYVWNKWDSMLIFWRECFTQHDFGGYTEFVDVGDGSFIACS